MLAVGADIATRFAAWWLTESGADVAVYRPGWRPGPADDAEARFERLAGRGLRAADFGADRPYAALIGDAASLAALSDAIPARLRTEASVVEVTSPLPTGGSFAETQLYDMALWARSGLGYLTSEITPAWGMGEPCLPLKPSGQPLGRGRRRDRGRGRRADPRVRRAAAPRLVRQAGTAGAAAHAAHRLRAAGRSGRRPRRAGALPRRHDGRRRRDGVRRGHRSQALGLALPHRRRTRLGRRRRRAGDGHSARGARPDRRPPA